MRYKLIFALLAIALVTVSCKTAKIKKVPNSETKLLERVKEYEASLSAPNKEKAWEMRSASFKKKFPKDSYLEFLKNDINYCSDYKRKYEIIYLDIRKDKAKVKMSQSLLPVNGGEPEVSRSYYFWIFEKGNWYLAESGETGGKADWW